MKHLPGILFLIAMPLSVWLYVKVDAVLQSEVLALLSAVGLYILLALVIGFVFSRKAMKSDGQSRSDEKCAENHTK